MNSFSKLRVSFAGVVVTSVTLITSFGVTLFTRLGAVVVTFLTVALDSLTMGVADLAVLRDADDLCLLPCSQKINNRCEGDTTTRVQ